jgi:hypothetical protein
MHKPSPKTRRATQNPTLHTNVAHPVSMRPGPEIPPGYDLREGRKRRRVEILPLLMEYTLEDQEHCLLVKVIDRVLYKLDDLIRPYVHKILVVIEPLLIDEDYYARVEGREIISNLSKAAGLAHELDHAS